MCFWVLWTRRIKIVHRKASYTNIRLNHNIQVQLSIYKVSLLNNYYLFFCRFSWNLKLSSKYCKFNLVHLMIYWIKRSTFLLAFTVSFKYTNNFFLILTRKCLKLVSGGKIVNIILQIKKYLWTVENILFYLTNLIFGSPIKKFKLYPFKMSTCHIRQISLPKPYSKVLCTHHSTTSTYCLRNETIKDKHLVSGSDWLCNFDLWVNLLEWNVNSLIILKFILIKKGTNYLYLNFIEI